MHHLQNELDIEYITGDNRILPFALDAPRLKCSFDLVFHNLLKRHWTNKQALAFMKRECFMEELTQDILKKATNARGLEEINMGASKECPQSQHIILQDAFNNPNAYKKPEPPKSWEVSGGLSVYIDVLMHLLFLGIVKSTLKTIRMWLCKQGNNAQFHRLMDQFNERLNTIKLDWLKYEEYRATGKFGGWVSETFLDFPACCCGSSKTFQILAQLQIVQSPLLVLI
jgi:hypothetical protein